MLRKLASQPDWQIALAVTATLRILYSALAGIFFLFLHPDPALIHSNMLTEHLPAPQGLHYALLGIWQRFDTLWYLHIAEHGYDLPAAVVFYPLYPLTIRLGSYLISPIAAALLISTIAAFFVFWGMLRVAGSELSEVGKFRALFLFCVWPTGFVLFAGYTESLTLALMVWAITFARDARWEMAAVCGLLAGLARSAGVLIFVPLAVMALRSRQARSAMVGLTPVGFLSYWYWLRWSGRISIVKAYLTYWGTRIAPPWTTIWGALASSVKHFDVFVLINLVALLLMLAAGLSARRRIADRFFSAAVISQILMRVSVPPLLGLPRYVLPVYPAYLTMGEQTEKMLPNRFAFLSSALFLFNLAWLWAFLNWSLVL
jgi:Gpi18-like mannosyltransferase